MNRQLSSVKSNFELGLIIGSGSFGTVYEATVVRSTVNGLIAGSKVAIKK